MQAITLSEAHELREMMFVLESLGLTPEFVVFSAMRNRIFDDPCDAGMEILGDALFGRFVALFDKAEKTYKGAAAMLWMEVVTERRTFVNIC